MNADDTRRELVSLSHFLGDDSHRLAILGEGNVKAAMLMAHKSAEIFVGAAALGGAVFMSDADVERIATRSDERYRQRALKL